MTRSVYVGAVLLCAAMLPLTAANALTGDEIALAVYNRDDGEDSYSEIRMVLTDKKGNERHRDLIAYNKDCGELSKNLIRFLSPADIEGTGFLSWENEEGDDTQYLYLPDLGRFRRIVSSQKDLRFVNTDFTYEDMQRRKPEKDAHAIVGEEDWEGHSCYVLEDIPKIKKSSQYSKIIRWIEKESMVPVKIELYNKKGEMFKRYTVEELEKIDGIWTEKTVLMNDLSEEHTTRMRISEIMYNRGLDDKTFTLQNLEDY